jgi:hypothetical protein
MIEIVEFVRQERALVVWVAVLVVAGVTHAGYIWRSVARWRIPATTLNANKQAGGRAVSMPPYGSTAVSDTIAI